MSLIRKCKRWLYREYPELYFRLYYLLYASFYKKYFSQKDPLDPPKFNLRRKGIRFIQIGANDGVTNDPLFKYIRRYDWSGIRVEPGEYAFKRLEWVHRNDPDVRLEKVLIGAEDGALDFFHIASRTGEVPAHLTQVSSLLAETLSKYIESDDLFVQSRRIPSQRLSTLVKKHGFGDVDLIHIDAEGYDHEILKTIDFNLIRPRIIMYEHKHLSSDDYGATGELLQANGYVLLKLKDDTIAYKDSLTK